MHFIITQPGLHTYRKYQLQSYHNIVRNKRIYEILDYYNLISHCLKIRIFFHEERGHSELMFYT